jgi:hypothetical protein
VELYDEIGVDAQADGLVVEARFALVGGFSELAHLVFEFLILLILELHVLDGHYALPGSANITSV